MRIGIPTHTYQICPSEITIKGIRVGRGSKGPLRKGFMLQKNGLWGSRVKAARSAKFYHELTYTVVTTTEISNKLKHKPIQYFF